MDLVKTQFRDTYNARMDISATKIILLAVAKSPLGEMTTILQNLHSN